MTAPPVGALAGSIYVWRKTTAKRLATLNQRVRGRGSVVFYRAGLRWRVDWWVDPPNVTRVEGLDRLGDELRRGFHTTTEPQDG